MTAPFDHFRSGEAGFVVLVHRRRPQLGAVAKLILALAGVALVPLLAAAGSFAVVHQFDHRCPAPVLLRGSIAPERDLAKLEMPEDQGR